MSAPLGPGAPDENDASTQATPASADPLQLNGPELEPEEMAALAAVLEAAAAARAEAARLAAEAADRRPRDRTLRRRGGVGVWARPGRGQWRQGAGPQ